MPSVGSWTSTFGPGDPVVVRDVWSERILAARPVTVLEDTGDTVALHLAAGTNCIWPTIETRSDAIPRLASGDFETAYREWTDNHVLILMRAGDRYSPQLLVRDDGSSRFWYVNIQTPFVRTAIGFDYKDLILDILAGPELDQWQWKDEYELDQAVELGMITSDDRDEIRDAGATAVAEIESGEAWWKAWNDWTPDLPSLIPSLPEDWHRL